MIPAPLIFIVIIVDCIFVYFIFIVIRGVIRFFRRLFSGNKQNENSLRTDKVFWPPTWTPTPAVLAAPTQEEKYPYEKQDYLLTPTELKFYRVLKPICDERNLAVFAKVRLEDIVTVPKDMLDNWKWRGYIRSRHIDFVLCDANNLKIHCGLELDDWHHKFFKNHAIDERKDKIMRDAGLSLIRIKAGPIYDIVEIGRTIDSAILQNSRFI